MFALHIGFFRHPQNVRLYYFDIRPTAMLFIFLFISDNKRIDIPTAPPQILSKLFPQTSGQIHDDEQREKEQQRKDEDDKKEQANAWKRMKLG